MTTYSPEKIALIKRTLMPAGSTDDELELFVNQCERTGLDPFIRQIYPTKRHDRTKNTDVMTISISIDGARLTAERSQRYQGQIGPEWCGPDGVWKDVWLSSTPPAAARVGVLKAGFTQPLYGVALFKEYAQLKDGKPVFMWASKPALMIAKCAEALALRKAFPMELSGMYTKEEIPDLEPAEALPAGQIVDGQFRQLNPGPAAKVDPAMTVVQNLTANGGEVTMTLDKAVAVVDRKTGKSFGDMAEEELREYKSRVLANVKGLSGEKLAEASDRLRAVDLILSSMTPPEPEFPPEG